jgi:membrane-associated phospholipid phosphatase
MKHKVIKIRNVACVLGIVLLCLFYFFSRAVNHGFLKQTDFAMTVKLQDEVDKSTRLRLASAVGNVFEGSTLFAGPQVTSVIVGIITLAALIDTKRKRVRWNAILIPVLFGALVLGELYGKSVVQHPSPPFFMIKNPTSIFPKYYINERYSYPSGHTARTVFIGFVALSLVASYLSLSKQNLKRWLVAGGTITACIVIVATGMIYLGHHWLSDVIGGGLLGAGFGLLTLTVISPIIDKQ